MQELVQELGRYIAGAITADEFRTAVDAYVRTHPERRDEARQWFLAGVQSGRLSAGIGDLVTDLFSRAAAAGAPGGEPTRAAVDSAKATLQSAKATLQAPKATLQSPQAAVQSVQVTGQPTDPGAAAGELHPLRIGAILLNRYRLVSELGQGGMGQVFKAADQYLEGVGKRNPFVALKALNPTYVEDQSARTALLDETMRAKTLSHDNIVRVDNFDWDGPYIFITMEYLRGRPLDGLMVSDYASGMTLPTAWPIIDKICDALDYAHRKGVVHSDIKPSNVFITQKNVVKVLDFGISRLMARSAALQNETQFVPDTPSSGLTPAYAALEQWGGEAPDPRDDIYALGLVVYELLTGHHPFAGASSVRAWEAGLEPKRIEALSRAQWEALRGALALKREARTKTVKEFQRCFAPVTVLRKYRLLIGGGAVATAAAAIALGSHEYSLHVEQQMLCAGPAASAPATLTAAQRQQIGDDLFLAQDYLRDVKTDLKADDLAYVLSEGANNVNQILDSILALDTRNAPALKMKTQIANLYLQKARELRDQQQLKPALALVRYGLKVNCGNLDLFHLQRDLCQADASMCPG